MTQNDLNPKTLKQLYNKTLEKYEARLDKLEIVFDNRCEEIRVAAHKKLDALPKSDRFGRTRVLEEEKSELDQAVSELKTAIAKSSQENRDALAKIQAQIDSLRA